MNTTSNALSTVLNLLYARTVLVRDVDAPLGSFHGLGLNDLALLLELNEAPNGTMRRVDLAGRLGITTSGVARQLGPLERIGLVDRESSPGDARLALVVLTESGRRVVGEALPTAEEAAERALSRLWSDADTADVGRLVAGLRD
jgi:DNA-binding MarR family transcriptional regulator